MLFVTVLNPYRRGMHDLGPRGFASRPMEWHDASPPLDVSFVLGSPQNCLMMMFTLDRLYTIILTNLMTEWPCFLQRSSTIQARTDSYHHWLESCRGWFMNRVTRANERNSSAQWTQVFIRSNRLAHLFNYQYDKSYDQLLKLDRERSKNTDPSHTMHIVK